MMCMNQCDYPSDDGGPCRCEQDAINSRKQAKQEEPVVTHENGMTTIEMCEKILAGDYAQFEEDGTDIDSVCEDIAEAYTKLRAKAVEVLEWYYRDGSVGGAGEPMEALQEEVDVSTEWLHRK